MRSFGGWPSLSGDRSLKETLPCPICGHSTERRFETHGHWLRECAGCQHQFFESAVRADHVAQIYGDDYFAGGGAGYPDYLGEGDLLRKRGCWYARQLARYMPVGTVLDVGAAAGFILKGLEDAGWRGEGVEPNETMARHAREVLELSVSITDLEGLVCDKQFDLVSMIQVIAHFVDLRIALAKVTKALKPGGHLLVETWNSRSLTARLLGKRWHEYSPPSVLHCFSLKSLSHLTAKEGFHEVARGRPSKWISGGHAKALLRYKFGDVKWVERLMLMIPERASFPYPAEDLVWVLLKKKLSRC